jgi:hypothetical protein
MRVNTFLVFAAQRKTTAANVHKATALIRGYEIAVEVAAHPRCPNRPDARRRVSVAESELERFCYGGSR